MDDQELQRLQDYHNQIFPRAHEREASLLKLLGFVLPALAIVAYAGKVYLVGEEEEVSKHSKEALKLLSVSVFIAVLLLTWAQAFVLAHAYWFRCLQFVFSRVQEALDVIKYSPEFWHFDDICETWENKTRKCSAIWRFVGWIPEIYKTHFVVLFLAEIAMILEYLYLFSCSQHGTIEAKILVGIFFIAVSVVMALSKKYNGKLWDQLKSHKKIRNSLSESQGSEASPQSQE